MSGKTIRLIIAIMLLTLGALFVTQGYWFNKSFRLEERQFDEKLNVALRNVADRLLKQDNDSLSRIAPVVKLSSNEFYVRTECYFNIKSLDSILKNEFSIRDIDINYDYLILKSVSNEIILGNTLSSAFDTSEAACLERTDGRENVDFKVRVNNKTTYLLGAMGIWMYSSITLLLVLAVFTFIVISIIKGKKLALLKKDFVNNMTHELKTPIANISVASEALRNKEMNEVKRKQYADIIYKENEKLHGLVDKVMQISSLEKEEDTFSFEELNIHEIISTITSSFGPVVLSKNGIINHDLKANNFKVIGDKTHLSNAISNLIDNAIKYSNNVLEIVVKSKNRKDGILLEITDKGIGVAKENQHKIFDRFFREESGDLHNTKGYGLGLSYVKFIVEKHNGAITFNSAKDLGSTFSIFLPQ
ncbi:sensor histidine kinase [Seonamhaeicola maritimus]|uniref:histidine kinase n=1 Tax=Seonamhaeicola maritimus TaxID=2591822 RepID=A0A5C7GK71_9FLAO|nr:HAMP domain-containing sensor histidine kinase [Seonamhaeicola maritimus]TXG38839.1 HAMP domain-containing histidine kinase [Seonamhaeicola maritimus]